MSSHIMRFSFYIYAEGRRTDIAGIIIYGYIYLYSYDTSLYMDSEWG